MSTIEKDLAELGITFNSSDTTARAAADLAFYEIAQGPLAFSAYGAFTPITVGSSTRVTNANLERDKY